MKPLFGDLNELVTVQGLDSRMKKRVRENGAEMRVVRRATFKGVASVLLAAEKPDWAGWAALTSVELLPRNG